MMTRTEFLRMCGATAPSMWFSPRLEAAEEMRLKSWELVTGMSATKLHFPKRVFPIAEFPMGEDVPKEFMSGPWLLGPDWPGIYRIE